MLRREPLGRARDQGRDLALLAVEAVVASDLTRAADFVLPGASYLEKDACYTNDKGMVQAAAHTNGRANGKTAIPLVPTMR